MDQTRTSTPEASTTQTQTTSPPSPAPSNLVLRLRGAHSTRHIQWASDVVDNEGLGRKKSKVCCIYHKPRDVGESSSEDDSSDDDDGSARPAGGRKHNCSKDKAKRKPSPNAYEKMPRYDVKK